MNRFTLAADQIFDGERFHHNSAIVIEGDRIVDLVPSHSAEHPLHLGSGTLAPGFIDVQVNGGGGALLNDNPNLDTVKRIAQSHRKFGTTGLLPTVITDQPRIINQAIASVSTAIATHTPGVLGIHIEGPFLDPQRKGAHHPAYIRKPEPQDIDQLCTLRCGTVMITLAPNVVSTDDIRRLSQAGLRVSLGHSDASFAQANQALKAGATGFTHVFNAMSQLTGREPGMVGAALADRSSSIGVIADGHHVHDVTLKLAIAAATHPTHHRFMLVSDAMPSAAGGPDTFFLQGRAVRRLHDKLTLDDGTLAGSCLTMDAAVRHVVHNLGLPLARALQMASRNPARFLGRSDLGVVDIGARASLVHLTNELHVAQTWIDGA